MKINRTVASKIGLFRGLISNLGVLILISSMLVCSIPGGGRTLTDSDAITPHVSVFPTLFPIGERSSLVITLSNKNSNSLRGIEPGDTFSFTFGAQAGSEIKLESAVLVNSSQFGVDNFTVSINASANQVSVTYQGPETAFPAADLFGVKLSLLAPSQLALEAS